MNYLQLAEMRSQILALLNQVDYHMETITKFSNRREQATALVLTLPLEPTRGGELSMQAFQADLSWRNDVIPVLRSLGWTQKRGPKGVTWFPPPAAQALSSEPTQQT